MSVLCERHFTIVFFMLTYAIVFIDRLHAKPNVIIFNADDLGWGDLSCYGHPTQEWGPVDDLARDGMRFTNMYAAASMCTPSRSGLLTGRLPIRIGTYGRLQVFFPHSINGLPREEITIAEALKDAGYTTGIIGKWHLGINAFNHTDGSHLPYNHGFDYVGLNLPLSNAWQCDDQQIHLPSPDPLFCVLYNNATIVQQPFSHSGQLTSTFVENAKGFIQISQKNKRPFFLYFALAQPHVSLFNTDGFAGTSIRGRYGDNIREMAWAVGEVMDEVKRLKLDSNTIMFFISDNGPHLNLCNEGGDAGTLKGGKGQTWEGGIRVPGIVRWPGHIKPGTVSNKLVSQLDILPTILSLAGGRIPDDRTLDGQDISNILFDLQDKAQPLPVEAKPIFTERLKQQGSRLLVFFCQETLFAVRYGSYKFHFFTTGAITKEQSATHCGNGGLPLEFNVDCMHCENSDCTTAYDPPLMYNLDKDPNEAYPLDPSLAKYKVVLEEMLAELKEFQSGLIKAPGLIDSVSNDTFPCCTPETYPVCTCDFLPTEHADDSNP